MLLNFEARVLKTIENNGNYWIVLDKTAFYPRGGGQECDKGYLVNENNERIDVLEVIKKDIITSGTDEFTSKWSFMDGKKGRELLKLNLDIFKIVRLTKKELILEINSSYSTSGNVSNPTSIVVEQRFEYSKMD